MKCILSIFAVIFSFSTPVFACSESGPHEFDISPHVQSVCSKAALKYARGLANVMVTTEKLEKGYKGPDGGFTSDKSAPGLYTAQKRTGNSKLIGFNVGLKSKNQWECNFCVDLSLDESGICHIESIKKHMCAK